MKSPKSSSSSSASPGSDNPNRKLASRSPDAADENTTSNASVRRGQSARRDTTSTSRNATSAANRGYDDENESGQSQQASLSASNPNRSPDYYHGFHEGFHHGVGNRQSGSYNSQGQRSSGRYSGYNENDTGYDAQRRGRYDDNDQDYHRAQGEIRGGSSYDDRSGWQRSGGTSENPEYDRDQERYAGEERFRNASDARRNDDGSYYRAADDRYDSAMRQGDDYDRDERSSSRSGSKSNRGNSRNR